jgi:hypothetical protein
MLGIGVLAVLGVLGWLGFVPGLSRLIGPEPRDLGVELSVDAAYECADAFNLPNTVDDLRSIQDDPTTFTEFDTTLTSEQASSLLLYGQDEIPNWPIEFVQLRFNGDGTAEASGVFDLDDVRPFLLNNLGVPSGDAETAISRVELFNDMPFYVKGDCGVQNNRVGLSLSEVQIGRMTVPASWYQGNESEGTQYIDSALDREGFAVEEVSVSGGSVYARGTRPLSSLVPWLGIVRDDRVVEE